MADFNRQALDWRQQVAHQRHWPGDDSRTVAQVFAEEQPHLLPLPAHPFACDLTRTVYADKTLCVRFDLNDYSVPPRALGRALTLVASPSTVRMLDGTTEIASHPRSYDRHQLVEVPAHRHALLEQKRKALGSTPSGRLATLLTESQAFLQAAFECGESTARLTLQLLHLLDDYGAGELAAALREALDGHTPRLSSVAFILARPHDAAGGNTSTSLGATLRTRLRTFAFKTFQHQRLLPGSPRINWPRQCSGGVVGRERTNRSALRFSIRVTNEAVY